jgi:hypothetical protein
MPAAWEGQFEFRDAGLWVAKLLLQLLFLS